MVESYKAAGNDESDTEDETEPEEGAAPVLPATGIASAAEAGLRKEEVTGPWGSDADWRPFDLHAAAYSNPWGGLFGSMVPSTEPDQTKEQGGGPALYSNPWAAISLPADTPAPVGKKQEAKLKQDKQQEAGRKQDKQQKAKLKQDKQQEAGRKQAQRPLVPAPVQPGCLSSLPAYGVTADALDLGDQGPAHSDDSYDYERGAARAGRSAESSEDEAEAALAKVGAVALSGIAGASARWILIRAPASRFPLQAPLDGFRMPATEPAARAKHQQPKGQQPKGQKPKPEKGKPNPAKAAAARAPEERLTVRRRAPEPELPAVDLMDSGEIAALQGNAARPLPSRAKGAAR